MYRHVVTICDGILLGMDVYSNVCDVMYSDVCSNVYSDMYVVMYICVVMYILTEMDLTPLDVCLLK